MKKEYYKPKEVANMLGVTSRTVSNWVKKGLLNGHQTLGGHNRISGESVRELGQKMGMNL